MPSPQNPEIAKDFAKSDFYVLSTDFQGTARLALQQYIWQQALAFNIHPTIPKLPQNAYVADVAAGTGLWLVEVGRSLGPDASLAAFDINLNQAPPKPWLPSNMDLHEWNIFEEPPFEFQGLFDLVHVRLITVVIKDSDPKGVTQNLAKLLKPGGWLQWDEVDFSGSFVVKAYENMSTPAMDAWCNWMASPKRETKTNMDKVWKEGATTMLSESGFEQAERHDLVKSFTDHMELMRYNSDQLLMLSEQYARRVYNGSHDKGNELLRMIAAASKESGQGSAMIMPPLMWTARKMA